MVRRTPLRGCGGGGQSFKSREGVECGCIAVKTESSHSESIESNYLSLSAVSASSIARTA